MAGMINLGKKIQIGLRSGGIPSPSYIGAALTGFSKRSHSSSGDGRYVPGNSNNVFVEETNQEGQTSWAPPTQGGFVESFPGAGGAPPIPPTQGGFVDHQSYGRAPNDGFVPVVTQGGFVPGSVDYNGYQAPHYAANAYGQYPEYGYVPPPPPVHLPPPPPPLPPPPPPTYPHAHGPYIGDNPWVPPYQVAPYAYPVQPPPPPPPGYVEPVQPPPPPYVEPVQPPPPSYVKPVQPPPPPYVEPVQLPPPTFVEAPQHDHPNYMYQPNQVAPHEYTYGQQGAAYGQDVSSASVQQTNFVQQETTVQPNTVYEQSTLETPEKVLASAHAPVETEAPAVESSIDAESVAGHEVTEEISADEIEQPVPSEAKTAHEEHNTEAMASAEHDEEQPEYDATAAAMAEVGVSPSSSEVADDNEDNEDKVVDSEPQAVEEPVKGIESLLEVETSKAPPAPPPSSESFLDLLSKTNLNARQTRPRPQLSFRTSQQRKTYARLHNLPRQILKSDIVNYFAEVGVQKDHVHITYDEKFYPIYAQVAFESGEALRNAQKILATKGRFGGRIVRMDTFINFQAPTHPQINDTMKNYLGRMLLMLHLPPEGRVEDVERFFDGYGYDPSALTMLETINMTLARFPKEGNRPVRRAAIGFFSSLEAMRALRDKQGDFILNEPIELRLIQ